MEYQFDFDPQYHVVVHCSMGHEAFANWANTEMQTDRTHLKQLMTRIQNTITQRSMQNDTIIGHEFSLRFNSDEVQVFANALGNDNALVEQIGDELDLHYYDDELHASCGTEDFYIFLHHYYHFLTGSSSSCRQGC